MRGTAGMAVYIRMEDFSRPASHLARLLNYV